MFTSRWSRAAIAAALVTVTITPLTASVRAADPDPIPITDPIEAEIKPSNLGLVLEEYAQLPPSATAEPASNPNVASRHNRINFINEIRDGSGRMYVPDLNGPLYLLDGGDQHVYLDFFERFPHFYTWRGLGTGFGFVTFHPDFGDNGKLYTVHSETTDTTAEPTYPAQGTSLQSVVMEWTADDPTANVFSGTSRDIFRYQFGGTSHAIQQIDFNFTAEPGDEDYGLLYLAVGDGGRGATSDIPQDMTTPSGKILRIDPAGTNGPNGQYGIPESNPFVGEPGVVEEIYALGMRDPHRFSWDPRGNNRMYLGHIGQKAIEAVYEVNAGDNFGWPLIEGRLAYDHDTQCWLYPLTPELAASGFDYPLASYDHDSPSNWGCNSDSGHAISGGFVHRGDLDGLYGKYVFGDLVEGRVFATDLNGASSSEEATIKELALYDTDGNRMRMADFAGDGRIDLRFGTDANDGLYLLAKANGKIWKAVDTKWAPVPEILPASLQKELVAFYDFEHPFPADDSFEEDQGKSVALLQLVEGGEDMRMPGGAYGGSNNSLQTFSAASSPTGAAWMGGVFDSVDAGRNDPPDTNGVDSLSTLGGTKGITVMGWFDVTTADGSGDISLVRVVDGPDGDAARALLSLENVDGELRLVARGTRLDGGSSQAFVSSTAWADLAPSDGWVHLTATFDYANGKIALYVDGRAVKGSYADPANPWLVDGTGTSPTNPRSIEIGGSITMDGEAMNGCDCQIDAVMVFDDDLRPTEVKNQYQRFVNQRN